MCTAFLLCTAAVYALAANASSECSTDEDCSLNGVCNSRACQCDPGWVGDGCAHLLVGSAAPYPSNGVYGADLGPFGRSTWGGNSIWDSTTQLWHLFVTEIAGKQCGLHNWQGHSTVTHATAKTLLGPYTKQSTAIQQQAHNPQAIRRGSKWYIFHIGSGAGSKFPPPACNETLPPTLTSTGVTTKTVVPSTPSTTVAVEAATSRGDVAGLSAPGQCPAGPPSYTLHPAACVSGTKCSSGEHCNCGPNIGSGDCSTAGSMAACLATATAWCDGNTQCHSVAIRSRGCAAGSSFRWQAFRFGGAGSAVANSDWTAYTKSGPPAPSPSPLPPPPPPSPSGGSIHVADSPYGPWLPLQSPSPKCNNPSPAVHPNGTLFLACTWKLYSAPSIAGPWSDGIDLHPPHGGWEDPFLFFDRRGHFHILSHVYSKAGSGINNTISGHAFSVDGLSWTFSQTQPYSNVVQDVDGGVHTFATLERRVAHSSRPHLVVFFFVGGGGVFSPSEDND